MQALHNLSRYEGIRQDTSTSSGRGNDQLGKNMPARDWARPKGRYGARWLLLSDCKYFLRYPYWRHLYFPSIARHCKEMRQLWLELNIKPEWLSYKQIGRIEHKMNRMKTKLDRQLKIDHLKETEDNDRTGV